MRCLGVVVVLSAFGGCGLGGQAEEPCAPVNPLVVRVGKDLYRITERDLVYVRSDVVEDARREVDGVRLASYCIRGGQAVPTAKGISIDAEGLRGLAPRYDALKQATQVSIEAEGGLPRPTPGPQSTDPSTGLPRSGGSRVYSLTASQLDGWAQPVQAECEQKLAPTVGANCRIFAPISGGKRLRIQVDTSRVPVSDWPKVLRSSQLLFESMRESHAQGE